MSFVRNMRNVADELITKYGSDIVLIQIVSTGFDTVEGKNVTTEVQHNTKGHVSHYVSSDLVQDIVLMDDLKVIVYADGMNITKEWEMSFRGMVYQILHVNDITAQNEKVIYTLQCRSRNA